MFTLINEKLIRDYLGKGLCKAIFNQVYIFNQGASEI